MAAGILYRYHVFPKRSCGTAAACHLETSGTRLRQHVLTLSELLRLPETEPASECVDGRIIRKVSPEGKHTRLEFRRAERLNQAAEPECRGVAFPELRCTFAGRSFVHDVAFFT